MATIKDFEELQSWKKARELAGYIYELTRHEAFARDFELRDQIRGAAGSVMHNIAEGFEAGTDTEFRRFLRFARRSASEVQSELYLAFDCRYITEAERRRAHDLALEAKKLINGMIGYLNATHNRRIGDTSTARPSRYKTNRLQD